MNSPSNVVSTGKRVRKVGARAYLDLYVSCLVLGVSFIVLGALTIMLFFSTDSWQKFLVSFEKVLEDGNSSIMFSAHLLGMFATIAFIALIALCATLLHLFIKHSFRYDKVLAALKFTLRNDRDPTVRAKAAKGLADLDVEEASVYEQHEKLDDSLITAMLKDTSPLVRGATAEGLSNLELEEHSYQHKHHQLDDLLFEEQPQKPDAEA